MLTPLHIHFCIEIFFTFNPPYCGRYVGIIGAFIGGAISVIVVYFSSSRKIIKETSGRINKDGYVVLKGNSNNKFVTYFSFIFGGISIGFSFIYLSTEVSNTIMIFALGLFFILIGFFFIKFTNDNRIEYNNKEIKQYLMLRKKSRVIKWNELNRIEYKNIGSLLVLKSEHTVIYVDLRFDGISSLIKFISSKADFKNVEGFDKVFSNKR
jgi:hypothetical protein